VYYILILLQVSLSSSVAPSCLLAGKPLHSAAMWAELKKPKKTFVHLRANQEVEHSSGLFAWKIHWQVVYSFPLTEYIFLHERFSSRAATGKLQVELKKSL